jgi:choline kinase
VLLAPAEAYSDEDDGRNSAVERGDYSDEEAENLIQEDSYSDYDSGSVTPENRQTYAPSASSDASGSSHGANTLSQRENVTSNAKFATPTNGNAVTKGTGDMRGDLNGHGHATNGTVKPYRADNFPGGPKGWWLRAQYSVHGFFKSISEAASRVSQRMFSALPLWLQRMLTRLYSVTSKFMNGLWEFMNPPLWAMLAAIIVASVPKLQHLFFDPGSFISNSVTRAVSQSGQVAVPLILVVLGANLARNTLPKEDTHSIEDASVEKKLVIASLVSRMLIPTIIMAPLLAITAKFVPVSILDDPIFIVVCFLLTGAPSALQLAQICQINNVYMGAMSKLLFQSYVIWILPSTLVLVMLALETLEWAKLS